MIFFNLEINLHVDYQLLWDDSCIDHHFSYQLLKNNPSSDAIQYYEIVGSICKKSPQFSASKTSDKSSKEFNDPKTSSTERSLSHDVNSNHENLTINSSYFEKSIKSPPSSSNLDSKSFLEDPSNETAYLKNWSKKDESS